MYDFNYPDILPLPSLPSSFPPSVYVDSKTWYQELVNIIEYCNEVGNITNEMRSWLDEFIKTYGEKNNEVLNQIFNEWSKTPKTIDILKNGVFNNLMIEIDSLKNNKMDNDETIHWSQIGSDVREHIDGTGSGNLTSIVTGDNVAEKTLSRSKLNFYSQNTSLNKFDKHDIQKAKSLLDGVNVDNIGTGVSDYIGITSGATNVYLKTTGKIAFYDHDKKFIQQYQSTDGMNIPDTARYLKVDLLLSNVDKCYVGFEQSNYITPSYTDEFLSIKNKNIALSSVDRNKNNYPTYHTKGIFGRINIDFLNGNITTTDKIALSYGSGYKYIAEQSTCEIPDVTTPIYVGFLNNEIIATTDNELEDSSAYLVCTLYNGKVYADDYRNILVNDKPYTAYNYDGYVHYGNITVNHLSKNVVFEKGMVVTSNLGVFKFAENEDVIVEYDNSLPNIIVADLYENKLNVVPYVKIDNQIILAYIFRKKVYKVGDNSNITSYPTIETHNDNTLSLIDFGVTALSITDTETTKNIRITEGTIAINNNSSHFFRNNNEINIDFSDYDQTNSTVMSLFLEEGIISNNMSFSLATYYVDYSPRNINDIKFLSYYKGKIYGVDDVTRKLMVVNGNKNGGHGGDSTGYNDSSCGVSEWFTDVTSKFNGDVLWLGDSTWTVRPSTIPFPDKIQDLFNDYFGENKVKSINKSVGGVSIHYFADRINTLLNDNPTVKMVMIGAGLNLITPETVDSRKRSLEKIVVACLENNKIPVICTAQAHQVPNVQDGDSWNVRSQFYTEKYDKPIRESIANKYGLQLIDFTSFTQNLLDKTDEKISLLIPDGLHGSQLLHDKQVGWVFKELVETVKTINDNEIISLYDQKIYSDKSLRYIENINKDSYGFKSRWNYTSSTDDLLMEVILFLDIAKWKITAIGDTGNLNISVNDTSKDITLNGAVIIGQSYETGAYIIKVKSNGGLVQFNGLKVERI